MAGRSVLGRRSLTARQTFELPELQSISNSYCLDVSQSRPVHPVPTRFPKPARITSITLAVVERDVVARGATEGAIKLREDLLQVMAVQGTDELLRHCIDFTQRLGFETVAAMVVLDQSGGPGDFHTLHNSPASYKDEFQDREQGRRCPVMQHCKRSTLPIAWDQHTYTAAGLGPMWEGQAAHGFRTGIALAMHLSLGRHFFIGIDRQQPLPGDAAELTRLAAELQLFAVHAQDAALRLMGPHQQAGEPPTPPTARELETLRWTMEGKTAWEVGRILGISEQTVARHLHNATRKLDAVNKHQAVIKALRLGLLN